MSSLCFTFFTDIEQVIYLKQFDYFLNVRHYEGAVNLRMQYANDPNVDFNGHD